MKVWIVMRGCYSDLYFAGCYATAELAMASCPGSKWAYSETPEEWTNELDWGDACSVTATNVIGAPEAVPLADRSEA